MPHEPCTCFCEKGIIEVNDVALAAPVEYGGIVFPDGDISFADNVESFTPGDPAATLPGFTDPDEALGFVDLSDPAAPAPQTPPNSS